MFSHQENGDTRVIDRETGATNTITGGESLIRGYAQRDENVGWGTITSEFFMQQGPDNSLFTDFSGDSKSGPFGSLHSSLSSYTAPAREMSLNSNRSRDVFSMNYRNANPFVANGMWEQMWGRANVSWYKLGDKTMFMMNDSKSATSAFYRMSGNWERTPLTMMGNTRQTYIWVESNKALQHKVNENKAFWQRQLQKAIQDSKRPLPGKI